LVAMQRIRGIYALLDAFSLVIRRNQDAYLGILARGADEKLCETIARILHEKEIVERVKFYRRLVNSRTSPCEHRGQRFVTLPFIIVPSDVTSCNPRSALSRGKQSYPQMWTVFRN
jgi:hypothetical protein